MTQQFKFGDRVRDKTLGLGECVVINASDDAVYVMNTRGDYNVVARPEHLELIPHPDTVRLDWLGKNHAILYHNTAEDIKHGCAPIEVGCLYEEKPHGGDTVREAIDAAMSEKTT